MTADAVHPNAVSAAPTSIRGRLVRIAVLPLLLGAVLLLLAPVLLAVLPPVFLSGALAGASAFGGVATVGRGMRLIRRACTTVEARLSPVRLFFEYPDIPGRSIDEPLRDLEQALRTRVFGVVALIPDDQTVRLISALRRAAQDSPVRLGTEPDRQMSVLSQDCRRWLDTLA
ncbi:hypothetical protein ACIQVO_38665 [Streptomyces sp. NPDC101062]|uniref:hypothetical protein n=1 Tax=unclassified Streptomyces TaxID=2593676 RepID=UPI0037F6FFD5